MPKMLCRSCGSDRLISIDMAPAKDQSPLTITSCLRCEDRQWSDAGGRLARPDVLRRLAQRGNFDLVPGRDARRRARVGAG